MSNTSRMYKHCLIVIVVFEGRTIYAVIPPAGHAVRTFDSEYEAVAYADSLQLAPPTPRADAIDVAIAVAILLILAFITLRYIAPLP